MNEDDIGKGWVTSREFLEMLERKRQSNPEYRAKMEAIEARQRAIGEKRAQDEAPVVADLRSLGLEVDSVWDLLKIKEPYPEAIPVLLDHLQRPEHTGFTKNGIARALCVKESRPHWDKLRDIYLSSRDPKEQEGLGVALSGIMTKANLEDVYSLLEREELGMSRVFFLKPLKKLGGPVGLNVLLSFRDHPQLGTQSRLLTRRLA